MARAVQVQRTGAGLAVTHLKEHIDAVVAHRAVMVRPSTPVADLKRAEYRRARARRFSVQKRRPAGLQHPHHHGGDVVHGCRPTGSSVTGGSGSGRPARTGVISRNKGKGCGQAGVVSGAAVGRTARQEPHRQQQNIVADLRRPVAVHHQALFSVAHAASQQLVFQVRWPPRGRSVSWVSTRSRHANADMRQGRDHGSTSAVRVVSATCGLPLAVSLASQARSGR
jgi:hypothetical protein